jgi:hypothetical protein
VIIYNHSRALWYSIYMHVIEHTYVSLLADIASLSGFSEIRGSYEGLQWCLTEAPKLEKHILDCIENGCEPALDMFPVWLRRLAAGSVIDPVQLRYLRQLLLFCYKAEVTHDNETTEKAFKAFLEVNYTVGRFGGSLSGQSPRLLDSARRHCQSVLYRFNEKALSPSHGPGAVTTSKEKWQKRYSTIEYLYPYADYYSLYFNMDHSFEHSELDYDELIEAKLIAVPKDSRGPRLICVHPAEAIWLQQGLRRQLERAISSHRRCFGPWPQGHIHFDDQSVNGKIALLSSRSRRYATLDMKEASDRISEPLVQILFGDKYKYFGCCRAQKVLIPKVGSYANVRSDLNCYAPMGNATTFPVQSLVFWAICVASLQCRGFHQPGAVFVFGDDIIVPTECAEFVIDDLESFGLLVNRTKSFWRGAFRESCGIDAFNGVNVTPLRWKTTLDAEHVTGLQSLSDLAMRLRIAGYEEAARSTYHTLHTRFNHRYNPPKPAKYWSRRLQRWLAARPRRIGLTNNPEHGGLAEYVTLDSLVWADAYWHPRFQLFSNRVWRLQPQENKLKEHGWNHVLESVCSLERTGRASSPDRSASRRFVLDRGWTPVM